MPTENRSSNTDPRDVFIRLNPLGLGEEELRKDSTGFEDQRTHSDYLLFLAGYRETHAEPQPHPEPIAWMVGTAIWWTKEEAERDSAATGLPIVGLGPMPDAAPDEQHQGEPVGTLLIDEYFDGREVGDVDVQLDTKVCEQLAEKYPGQSLPLYICPAPADPGEVERRREEVETLRSPLGAEISKSTGLRTLADGANKWRQRAMDSQLASLDLTNDNNELRAKLAERDALLRETLGRIEDDWLMLDSEFGPAKGGLEGEIERGEEEIIPKLRAALSASTEQETHTFTGCIPGRSMVALAETQADLIGFSPIVGEGFKCQGNSLLSSAPVGDGITDDTEAVARMLGASVVEIDERADFEQWLNEHVANHAIHGEVLRRDYLDGEPADAAWEGWQARAALERKP